MSEQEKRIQTQSTLIQWVGWFMQENQVSASMMLDALNKASLQLKDIEIQELLQSLQKEDNNGNDTDSIGDSD